MTSTPASVYDLDDAGLRVLMEEAGEPGWRARQVAHWLWDRKVVDPEAMTDLPPRLRRWLAERWAGLGLQERSIQRADDGWTDKLLFGLAGGDAVETVIMWYRERVTVCISTQAGCAMGCAFCATGLGGFTRQLSAGEVVEQVARAWAALPALRPADGLPQRVTNVVFMGMGEPLANPTATFAAIEGLQRLGLSARALTVSTVGVVPQLRRLTQLAPSVNLAVSLHAPTNELRDRLVPVNRSWPLGQLLDAVGDHVSATHRRVSLEYVLLAGVNDLPEHAVELGRLAAAIRLPAGGCGAHVNLIAFNPTPGSGFDVPERGALRAFRDRVAARGVAVSIRGTRGANIQAACGQLRTAQGRPGRTVRAPGSFSVSPSLPVAGVPRLELAQ